MVGLKGTKVDRGMSHFTLRVTFMHSMFFFVTFAQLAGTLLPLLNDGKRTNFIMVDDSLISVVVANSLDNSLRCGVLSSNGPQGLWTTLEKSDLERII